MTEINKIYKDMIPKKLILPSNLDIDKLIQDKRPVFKVGKIDKFKALYLMSTLFSRVNTSKNHPAFEHSTMSSKKMGKEIYNYKEYLNWFKDCGFLEEENKGYSPNYYCKSYKISDRFRNSSKTAMIIPINKSKIFEKMANRKLPIKFVKEHLHLFKGFNDNLHIDKDVFDNYYSEVETYYKRQNYINSQKYTFSLDGFGNRFYSPITNIPKKLRHYLKYGNERLIELDTKNSLPYLLNYIMFKNLEQIEKEKDSGIMCEILDKSVNSQYIKYLKLTASGKIYEELNEFLLNIYGQDFYFNRVHRDKKTKKTQIISNYFPIEDYPNETARQRDMAKKLFIAHLFGEVGNKIEVDKFYQQLFPDVLDFIEHFKSSTFKIHQGYKRMSKELQKLESQIILSEISKEFCAENPEAVVYTVHDCIITQERFINSLETKAKEVFLRYLPIPPLFHQKEYCLPAKAA